MRIENDHRQIVVRPASEADCGEIGQLALQLLRHERSLYPQMGEPTPWAGSPAEIRKQMNQPGTRFFIARDGASIAGYIKVMIHGQSRQSAWRRAFDLVMRRPRPNVAAVGGVIAGIFVRETARRSGVGRLLLKHAEDWLRTQGMTSFNIQVLCANRAALRFWEQEGYAPLVIGLQKMEEGER